MSHLGSRISALADGQLAPAAAERALAHVATCPQCAGELAAARAARRALAAADDVTPTADLTARLLSLAPATPPRAPERRCDPFASPDPLRATPAGGSRLTGHPRTLTGDLERRRSGARIAAGSLAGLGAVAAMLFALGDRPPVVPSSHPAQALSLLGEATPGTERFAGAALTRGAPALAATSTVDQLERLRESGWTCPVELPPGWDVTAVRLDAREAVEIDLSGPGGTVVVTEQHGRLDVEALDGATHRTLGDRTVYVLSTHPWHAAWQSGDTVVEVVSASTSRDVESVVAEFPGGGFDDGVPARITRGWDTVTEALLNR
ncbi:zf-HC2 domain-containing protein [Cellulomonas cellasea]|uniref:Anti-sigma factor RsiW n=1 Tax=Cellulomonas cellasea TaxID=43670 RepID=A0A7W4YCN4_9CELL|nr:zf-HC2 domain-containing protein [Cellulomonas cellasea]MBB2923857.1 anti-sigma factor RsiW [Cellulomonas cellasea]